MTDLPVYVGGCETAATWRKDNIAFKITVMVARAAYQT